MKLLTCLLVLLTFTAKSQNVFVFEKVDSSKFNKAQLYAATKQFIATTWRSAAAVTQNDDKENGIITIRGSNTQNVSIIAGYAYVYSYDVTFRVKDNKYKVVLDNVVCDRAYMTTSTASIVKIQPFEGENAPETGTFGNPGIPKKNAIKMMANLKAELAAILTKYSEEITKPITTEDW